jgi:hypothetical protein
MDVIHHYMVYNNKMNDEDAPIKLSLSGKLNFEENITLSQAAQIVSFVDSSTGKTLATKTPGVALQQLGFPGAKSISATSNPREAIEISGAKTNPQRIVALAVYVIQDGDKETFTLDDIKPLFRRARHPLPKNITRDLDTAIKAGWIVESKIKGEFQVSDQAFRLLQSGFSSTKSTRTGNSKSKTSSSKTPRKQTANNSIPDVFSSIDEISNTLEGFLDYHQMKTKTDRFLWAINLAKNLGVNGVTNQDIVWLTDNLGEGIKAADIAGNFKANKRRGFANRSTLENKIRITPSGIKYLASLAAG